MSSPISYVSTRGGPAVDFVEALLTGVAPDGGLYVPDSWPALAVEALSQDDPSRMVRSIMGPLVGPALAGDALDSAVKRLAQAFANPRLTPLVEIEPDLFVLELFHGPSAAFKDYAMQMAASLTQAALAASGERLLVITATSGDTGAAAARAFADVEGVELIILHPLDRVSPVQRLQMTTTGAGNVRNLAVRGDFDDCQRLLKALLADEALRAGRRLSSLNSINWARLAGQIPYYVSAAQQLGARAPEATYVVPTGNFGDAFAGWAARRMGLPMGRLVAATNHNDALVRALQSGVYERVLSRPTASVSMDVQAPSNFERLVFEASGRDDTLVRSVFAAFGKDGRAVLPEPLLGMLRAEVSASAVGEDETAEEIADTWRRNGRVICPHTAVAMRVGRRQMGSGPVVVLSTAHPAKFPDSVERSLGFAPAQPPQLEGLEARPERFEVVDATLDAVRATL